MNSIKKTALTASILVALLGSVGCSANQSFIQSASNEVFAASEAAASDLYQNGQNAMNRGDWKKASKYFSDLIKRDTQHTDAALYWYAYSQYHSGKTSSANRSLNKLFKNHKQSQWVSEGKTLQAEILGVDSANSNDDDMKEIALHSLLNSSPERAIPILKKTLSSNNSDDIKEMALFILSQVGTPEARTLIESLALDNSNTQLQKNAIEMLAISGDKKSHEILSNLYNKVTEPEIREAILTGFMIAGDKDKLLQAAKTETNPELRATAAELLGVLGATEALLPLYKNEKSVEVKEQLLEALAMSGDTETLSYIIENEKDESLVINAIELSVIFGNSETFTSLNRTYKNTDNIQIKEAIIESHIIKHNEKGLLALLKEESNPELLETIIEMLGVMESDTSSTALTNFYKSTNNKELKSVVLEAYMIQGNAKRLIEIFRSEKDPQLKKEAASGLAMLNTEESREIMLELLEQE